MTAHLRFCTLGLALALAVVGCSRGADEARLRSDLQTRLNRDVKPDLFEVVTLRREGSSPMPAGASGASRVLVYFNTTLKLRQDYTFGGWDQLSPASVAFALGANEKGVFGLQAENKSGDMVRAYGSAVYEQGPNGWAEVTAAPTPTAAAARPEDIDGPSTRSKQLIDRLAAMVNIPPPGPSEQQDAIIADELARAEENIERRVKRRQQTFTVATGPQGGDYARMGDSLIAAINQAAPSLKLRQRFSDGSVDNARLLSTGDADYGFVQGDVAAAALAGQDAFAHTGPLETLRAVGGLFPEAVHVVVLAGSTITDVRQLRGKRVNLGPASSGSRFDALAVLGAYGMKPSDLSEAGSEPLAAAIARLKKQQIDALFATAPAPTRTLQELAVSPGIRLLPVNSTAVDELVRTQPGLMPLSLPANTYPQQKDRIATVGSVTLLVTTTAAPTAEVARVSDLIFNRMPQMKARSADVAEVSNLHGLRGVTIPLHPGAGQKVQ